MSERDRLFARPLAEIAGFRFDHRVAEVFPDMIRRSVPGYETIVAMTGTLAERYAQPGTRCYDLGCSLGASTLALRQGLGDRDCTIVAVDNAPAMIERCRRILAADAGRAPVDLRTADLRELEIANASLVVLNFTLQFVPPAERAPLIRRIRAGLVPGGVLVLSEKIAFADAELDRLMIDLHHAFKRANGYSELEIAQKRAALEQVLIPETLETHRRRLREAGFAAVDVWFQCFNFASLLAFA
ncbi:MAG: carboxy-S-adenosyl-L-methionine synthase CmoA [Pseudomonadota bacterium]|jgi:tRNA (cmo5U34)-methyltransferase